MMTHTQTNCNHGCLTIYFSFRYLNVWGKSMEPSKTAILHKAYQMVLRKDKTGLNFTFWQSARTQDEEQDDGAWRFGNQDFISSI